MGLAERLKRVVAALVFHQGNTAKGAAAQHRHLLEVVQLEGLGDFADLAPCRRANCQRFESNGHKGQEEGGDLADLTPRGTNS